MPEAGFGANAERCHQRPPQQRVAGKRLPGKHYPLAGNRRIERQGSVVEGVAHRHSRTGEAGGLQP